MIWRARPRSAAVANGLSANGNVLKQEATRIDGEPGQPAAESRPEQKKAPYAAPVLVQWGSLRDITQSVGRTGSPDGGRGRRRQTRA